MSPCISNRRSNLSEKFPRRNIWGGSWWNIRITNCGLPLSQTPTISDQPDRERDVQLNCPGDRVDIANDNNRINNGHCRGKPVEIYWWERILNVETDSIDYSIRGYSCGEVWRKCGNYFTVAISENRKIFSTLGEWQCLRSSWIIFRYQRKCFNR